MITFDIAIIATALGVIVTIWRFGTIIASVIATTQRAHDQLAFSVKELKASIERTKRRISAIEHAIMQHWSFQVRSSDITQDNFEDEE